MGARIIDCVKPIGKVINPNPLPIDFEALGFANGDVGCSANDFEFCHRVHWFCVQNTDAIPVSVVWLVHRGLCTSELS